MNKIKTGGGKTLRQSNFELLRIIAMLMVLALHADFMSLGLVRATDIETAPLSSFIRILVEVISIGAVNTFVMISGWFGIKFSIKGLCSFLFYCAYFYLGTYLCFVLFGDIPINKTQISSALLFVNWFVIAYTGLYILAPIINSFLKSATKRQMEIFLIAFFAYEIYFGWIGTSHIMVRGYSVTSFIGLYVLAFYLRHYCQKIHRYGFMIFLGSVVITTVLYYLNGLHVITIPSFIDLFSYVSPFVISSAAGLILWCSTWKFRPSRIINFIAASAYSAYLLHINSWVSGFFVTTNRYIYENYGGLKCFMYFVLFLIGIYIAALILDQPRKLIWRLISARFFTSKKSAQVVASSE